LIDDLWAMAVTHLPALSAYERRVNTESDLTGRNLEPWRAILAVALWLDDAGVDGLSKRMRNLSVGYQFERNDFENGDMVRLVVCTISTICTVSTINFETHQQEEITTAEITAKAKELAKDDEWDIDPEDVTSHKVGRTLGRLRLKKGERLKRGEPRKWVIGAADIERWRTVYSISESEKEGVPKTNGASGSNGANGAETESEWVG